MLFNYSEGLARRFEAKDEEEAAEVEAASMRRECRGLVLGPLGVVARPMHKFFEEGQTKDTKYGQVSDEMMQDARKKMDGTLVFGVVHPTDG